MLSWSGVVSVEWVRGGLFWTMFGDRMSQREGKRGVKGEPGLWTSHWADGGTLIEEGWGRCGDGGESAFVLAAVDWQYV